MASSTEDKSAEQYLQHRVSLDAIQRDGLVLIHVRDGVAVVGVHGSAPLAGDERFVPFMRKLDEIVISSGAAQVRTVDLSPQEFQLTLQVMFPRLIHPPPLAIYGENS